MLGGRGSGAESARAATAIRSVGARATRSVGDLNKDRPPSSSIDGTRWLDALARRVLVARVDALQARCGSSAVLRGA